MADPKRSPDAKSPALETKFYVPRWRPGQVSRSRLVERLKRGTQSKLTLISAPPGFGKTTLLAEFLASDPGPAKQLAWLSLDHNDNHPETFWTHLFGALQRMRPELGANAALSMVESPQPPPIESLLVMVLNEVAANPDELVLVLDDYHVIEAAQIHAGIEFLVDHLPPTMHLVLASRSDPPIPLPRLRARGELAEVRATDLRFTPEEAASFLNDAMGLHLSAKHVAALESRTEGWIAALQLAALSMQGRDDVPGFIGAFAGDDRYIVDYLVEEVLARQPAAVREFLLRTSILDGLFAPLCDAVTAQGSGKAMLDALERSNLFVLPLDDKRQWYRYHHLFADVLRAHLAAEQPEQVPDLHRRASEWYAADGQPDRAIQHALAANDLHRAAGLVELAAETIVRNHRPDRLVEWIRPIPDEIIRSMPVLSTYLALAFQGTGDLRASASHLNNAEQSLEESSDRAAMVVVDKEGFQSLPSRIALARGYLAIAAGDTTNTVEEARRALEYLPPDDHHWHGTAVALLSLAHWVSGDLDAAQPFHAEGVARFERTGDTGLAITSGYHDAELMKARGRLDDAQKRYEKSLQFAERHGGAAMRMAPNLHLGLSELCCERNDLVGAADHLQQAEKLGIFPPRTPYRHCLARARLRQAHGDLQGALELLEEAEQIHVRGAVPDVRPVGAWKARVWAAQGRLAAAMDWVRAEGLSVEDRPDYTREYQHITLARLLIARHQSEKDDESLRAVNRFLQRLSQATEAGGRIGALIEILVLQAIAQQALGDVASALSQVERALAFAEPERYVRTFLDEGTPMRDLLRHAVGQGVGGSYARQLLAAFETRSPAAAVNVAGLAESLTARELEILRLVAAGMRNQEIADHLVISLPTVKRHIANTYGKLGVRHRTEALARAKELSLLEAAPAP